MRITSAQLLHETSIRRFMHRCGLSPKKPVRVHVNKADKSEIQKSQRKMKKMTLRLEKRGFTVLVQDESIVTHNAILGHKHCSKTTTISYIDNHSKIVMYSEISNDYKQIFRIFKDLNRKPFCSISRICTNALVR